MMPSRYVSLLLNLGHAVDHMFLLIFATAVTSIAADFGFASWEDLMPYSVGAFFMFGMASLPAGRLGDLWGRRVMMLIFFFGMGVSAILVAFTQGPWQIAVALTLLGVFSAIYHPVGIPMLVQGSKNPGFTIGVNGLAGNLGIAVAALLTGLLVKYLGWRMAFVIPGLISIGIGIAFALGAAKETEAPAKRKPSVKPLPKNLLARVFMVMTLTAITGSLLFNFTTNGNTMLLRERFAGIIEDPATLGFMLAAVYAIASFAQVIVGSMIDRFPLKRVYLSVVLLQAPILLLAAYATGWSMWLLMIGFMVAIFGAIPFTDAMIVRYVDDGMRSRVSGVRLTVSFTGASLAVWALGPSVKASGFNTLLLVMAGIALCTLAIVLLLPDDRKVRVAQQAASAA